MAESAPILWITYKFEYRHLIKALKIRDMILTYKGGIIYVHHV